MKSLKMRVKPKKAFNVKKDRALEGVYWIKPKRKSKYILGTKNLTPGFSVYGERLFVYKKEEYREWVPHRSKLAAAIFKGLKTFPFREGSRVLYLGIAAGTTASHISDVVGERGIIYGIDISARVLRKSYILYEIRKNILPFLFDASFPEQYSSIIPNKVDVVYQDIAQKHQSSILIRNCELFLKRGGYAMIAIKARSIDVTKDPKEIFKLVERELREYFEVIERIRLDPYERDHMFFVLKY